MTDKGKVLAAAAGLAAGENGHIHGTTAQQFGHIGQGILGKRRIHHHAGAVVAELHISSAAIAAATPCAISVMRWWICSLTAPSGSTVRIVPHISAESGMTLDACQLQTGPW